MAKRSRNRHRRRNRKPKTTLPGKILYNILLMLPVKSLLRFKSVCKSWLSLISRRDFIEAHLSKSTNDPHFTLHHLNVSEAVDCAFFTCPVYSLLNEPAVTEPDEIDLPNKIPDTSYIGVIGYSNGLVCVAVKSFEDGWNVFLWNPSTRTSRRLPKSGLEYLCPLYLFCYDESNDDFKVFADLLDENGDLLVYSSKSDCWRVIENFDFSGINQAIFANGAVHCAVSRWREDGCQDSEFPLIISFDKKMKRHRLVLRPNYGEGECRCTLTAFGKNLSVLCGYEGGHADLWVMKKGDGGEVFWTKLFTIPSMDTLPSYKTLDPLCKNLNPLCISQNGQIMLQLASLVLLYDSQANTVKVLFDNRVENRSFADNGMEHLRALTWVESLVSPDI